MLEQKQISFGDEEDKFININNRRYLGNKYKLLDFINKITDENCEGIKSVADIFGGTGVVADNFNNMDKDIIVNDILYSNYIMYHTWFDSEEIDYFKIKRYIDKFNKMTVIEENYMSQNFGNTYFTVENARKIGYIREKIDNLYKKEKINFREKCILITSLLYAADKVANTCGHYDAYRKKLDTTQSLTLLVPKINNKNKNNKIYRKDANELVKEIYADLVYIDTPYNSRQYGDAYHLLENIAEWKKPDVEGVAKKMVNRKHIKSKYCTQKAPEAFKELIDNINAKYIMVSYNNMAEKGVGRSNAKISNEEIIEILESKGKLKIFETEYKAFTTGKTKHDDHKEIIYLCEVEDNREQNKKIKSCLNYTGGKFKLLDQILPLFPSDINTFVDIFCGGANIAINVNANKIICNDKQEQVISLFKTLKKYDKDIIFKELFNIIEEFNLSNTSDNGYERYNVSSDKGIGEYNKERYLSLREKYNRLINYLKLKEDFNELIDLEDDCLSKCNNKNYIKLKNKYKQLVNYLKIKDEFDNLDNNGKGYVKDLMFYLLTVYGFNNQIRFNSKGEYNIPVGKRDFNLNIRSNLSDFIDSIKKNDIIFINKDFRDFEWKSLNQDDFVYIDPPYLISKATYNEQGGWTEQDEVDLLNILDKLNDRGVRFALSNVISHCGEKNDILDDWRKKYTTNYLDFDYKNSNYQKKDKSSKSIEVLIINYKL